jgi:hypothetical protein
MRFFKVLLAVVVLAAVAVPNAMAFRFTDEARNTPTGVTGQAYNHPLTMAGGCLLVTMQINSGSLPPGLRLEGGTSDKTQDSWSIVGTPTTPGEFSFWIRAGSEWPECKDDSTEEYWTIRVTQGLAIQQASLPAGMIGKPYSFQFSAAGGGNQTWSATGLPAGLAMSSTGLLSGTPTAHTGGQTVTVTVSDGSRSASSNLTIAIRNPIAIEPVVVPVVGLDQAVSQVLRASGGNEQYTWALEGSVPPGLAIAAAPEDRFAAVLTGTATRAGVYPVIVKVTDSEGNWVTRPVTVTVASPVSIATRRFAALKVGRLYSLTIRARGGLPIRRLGRDTMNWRVVQGKLPLGLRLNARVGKLIGKPRRAGVYRFTIQVSDRLRSVDEQSFVLVVRR